MAGEHNQSGTPNEILDHIIDKLALKNDAALARYLEVAPPVISKMRHNRLPFGAQYIVRLHEKTGWAISNIKAYLPAEKEIAEATE